MKNLITNAEQEITNIIAAAQEQLKDSSSDQRSTLLHDCDDVIKRNPGTMRGIAAELVRAAVLLKNEGVECKKKN